MSSVWHIDFVWSRNTADTAVPHTRYRRNHAATDAVHLDAMTEYWALAENG
ncbi:MAG: hypothetical protein KAY37_13245 [Phycisphaerae bacterium]|nr:hypothetical protein [Phycisphaerae bacterium]